MKGWLRNLCVEWFGLGDICSTRRILITIIIGNSWVWEMVLPFWGCLWLSVGPDFIRLIHKSSWRTIRALAECHDAEKVLAWKKRVLEDGKSQLARKLILRNTMVRWRALIKSRWNTGYTRHTMPFSVHPHTQHRHHSGGRQRRWNGGKSLSGGP